MGQANLRMRIHAARPMSRAEIGDLDVEGPRLAGDHPEVVVQELQVRTVVAVAERAVLADTCQLGQTKALNGRPRRSSRRPWVQEGGDGVSVLRRNWRETQVTATLG